MANNTSCSAGRLTLIDPNAFDGQSSESNVPVQLEDLTIYVELTTTRKSRTILVSNGQSNTATNLRGVTVNFIEGTEYGENKRYLSTKFTDLTTAFDQGNESENLGITNIDIDFNSSMAPLITIQFVDVRGSAIFQNENNLRGQNKYSVLFELPYPLYKLKIKGYYGQPVEYCLHMTKFNSRFNSQTGNFEITANFVGYTYAMLSDMLVGYLKVISETKYGNEKYQELKREDPNILTLTEMYKAIEYINRGISKIPQTNQDFDRLAKNNAKKAFLDKLETNISIFGKSVDIEGKDLEKYEYIVANDDDSDNKNFIDSLSKYNTIVNEIDAFNTNYPDEKIDRNLYYINTDFNVLNRTLKSLKDFSETDSYNYVRTNYRLTEDKKFLIIDNKKKYSDIEKRRSALRVDDDNIRKSVGEQIRQDIKKEFNFEPTVRNIVKNLTTAVDVFLYVIYRVSKEAAAIDNADRKNALKKVFRADDIQNLTDVSIDNFYPWPEYREKKNINGDGAYVTEYLGKYGVLENPFDVDELRFIDDLYQAFIKQSQKQQDIDLTIQEVDSNWYPVNVLDTRLSGVNKFPYKRTSPTTVDDLIAYILIRATTFLSVTNKDLTQDEILSMAKIEAENMYTQSDNRSIVTILRNKTVDEILNSSFTVNNVSNIKILQPQNGDYKYSYFQDTQNKYFLPINESILKSDNSPLTINTIISDALKNGGLFISTYTSSGLSNQKPDDGAVYIKFYTQAEYENEIKNITTNTNVFSGQLPIIQYGTISDEKNTNPQSWGLNVFSGNYGIQTFKDVNWGTDIYNNLDYRYAFYENYPTLSSSNASQTRTKNLGNNNLYYYFSRNQNENIKKYSINNTILNGQFSAVNNLTTGFGYYSNDDIKYMFSAYENNGQAQEIDKLSYPFINFAVASGSAFRNKYSLFGSRLYYEQTQEEAKALLFLHTIPWKGLNGNTPNLFDRLEIYRALAYRGGFIYVPKLWAAFIGGILWRQKQSEDPIKFYNAGAINLPKSFIADFGDEISSEFYPAKNQYITAVDLENSGSLVLSNEIYFISDRYSNIDALLKSLPDQVQAEFENQFENFLTNDWPTIKNSLEIYDGDGTSWCNKFDTVFSGPFTYQNGETLLDVNLIKNNYKNYENYNIISPVIVNGQLDKRYNLSLALKDGSSIVSTIINLIREPIVLSNSTYRIWDNSAINVGEESTSNRINKDIIVNGTQIRDYLTAFIQQTQNNVAENDSFIKKQQDKQNLFGTTNEEIIKLNLYKNCKSIYDKWIGDVLSDDGNIMFQCGSRSNVDTQLAIKRTGNSSASPILIDNFRFVTRSFADIGDEMAINPIPINDYLRNNQNNSFYDLVTNLLSSNNFDFVPLPNFINYRDPELLASVFKPISINETVLNPQYTSGPTFVCVYVGERSKHLDFGNSNYPNDGFDVKCQDGNILPSTPSDFTKSSNPFEDVVTFFKVTYGQQNQNIFKDVVLDQSEFAETDESLKIIDDISSKFGETDRTFGGQNIFSVYSVRSYKAEIEMMGNAMIQPMMYFQLDNIPMFHGAYMITRVKHTIKPNFMSTNFTGVRIRKADTKIITSGDFYSALLDSLAVFEQSSTTQGQTTNRPLAPIVLTMTENGSVASNIISGNINMSPIRVPSGIVNEKEGTPSNRLLTESVDPLYRMLEDWVSWMKSNGFRGNNGNYAKIISAFRTYEQQSQLREALDNLAAPAGSSYHQWGVAIDFDFYTKEGVDISGKDGFDLKINESLVWLLDNSYAYGWIIPEGLRNGAGVEEYWHFEYHGKSAACILQKRPTAFGRTITVDKPYKDFVLNPRNPNGDRANYSDCTYKAPNNSGDGKEKAIKPENKNIQITPPSQDDKDFYEKVLRGIGAPITDENLKFFYAWRNAEGGTAAWNPFNTTWKNGFVTTNYNCNRNDKGVAYPVKNYQSKEDGINAMIKTLNQSYYPKIKNGLINNVGAWTLSTYIDELTTYGTRYGINEILKGATLKVEKISPVAGKTVTC
jgi:hypothetical protein